MSRLVTMRIAVAVFALCGFGWLIVTTRTGRPIPSDNALVWAVRGLIIPLTFTIVALLRQWFWARWLGLAGGLALLPWTTVIMLSPFEMIPAPRDWLLFVFTLMLLGALMGRPMFDAFEGRSQRWDWRQHPMPLVRWTIIMNIAAAFSLYLFTVAYEPGTAWLRVIPGGFLLVLVAGAWLLGHQKTLGFVIVGVGSVGLIPASAYFLVREARAAEEVVLFIILLAPAVMLSCGLLAVLGGPMLRYLRR